MSIKKQREQFKALAKQAKITVAQLTTLAAAEAKKDGLSLNTPEQWITAAELVTYFCTPQERLQSLLDLHIIELSQKLNPTITDAHTEPTNDPHFERFLHDTIRDMAHQSAKDGHWDCPKYRQ